MTDSVVARLSPRVDPAALRRQSRWHHPTSAQGLALL